MPALLHRLAENPGRAPLPLVLGEPTIQPRSVSLYAAPATPSCRRCPAQLAARACSRAAPNPGTNSEINKAIIATTTISSSNVNAARCRRDAPTEFGREPDPSTV